MLLQRAGFRIVARDVGALQIVLSSTMVASLLVSLLYGEWYSALGFLLAATTSAGIGFAVYRLAGTPGEPRSYHAMVIAAAGWLFGAAFGALPFLLIAYLTPDDVAQSFVPAGETYRSSLETFRNPLHAVFEAMSGYTTTSMTMAVHEPSLGKGLLFYRSAITWLGGAGMVILGLAILPRPGAAGGMQLYATEQSQSKVRPNILGTARAIWKIYAAATLAMAALLIVATLIFVPDHGLEATIFNSINHAMCALGTGGMSPLDDGIAGYHSYAMEMIFVVPMILGTISLPLLYLAVVQRDPGALWRDVQFRMMVGVLAIGTPLLCLALWGDPAVKDPIREGVFQFASAVSTTGWQTSNIGEWRDPGILLVVWGAMLTGGAAGATVGGIKLIRSYIIFRAAAWRIKRVFLPAEAVVPFKVGDRTIPSVDVQRDVADAAVFTFLFMVVLVIGMIVAAFFVEPPYTLADVLFETMSVQTTTGLSTGITGPDMPAALEVTFILQMWIGRLEIFPVIILIRALFVWQRRHGARL